MMSHYSFFAGLGFRGYHQDYVVPDDVVGINSTVDAQQKCMSVDYIMNTMKDSGVRLRIGLFDVCRNNPFDRGLHRGIVAEPAEGEIRIYSSSLDGIAMDGMNGHSPFTEGLIYAWKYHHGISLWNFINELADYVDNKTNGRQKVSFEGNFHGVFDFSAQPNSVR